MDAVYAQRKSAQKMAESQGEEKIANMQKGILNVIRERRGRKSGSATKTVYCYGGSSCGGGLLGTGTTTFCCNAQGGKSYKGTSSGATCYNC